MKKNLFAFLLASTIFLGGLIYTGSDASALAFYTLSDQEANPSAPITEINGVCYVGDDFRLSKFPQNVKKGEEIEISVCASSEIQISISVYYASGKSTSAVFSPKTASPSADATWKWKIPSNTSLGLARVVLRSENGYATFKINIV